MTDGGKEFSPIIRERLDEIGELTQADRMRMKELERLDSLLKDFYKGQLDALALWEQLKEMESPDKQFLLRDAYNKLKSSFKWLGLPMKFTEQSDGTLSIELRKDGAEAETAADGVGAEKQALVLELNAATFDDTVKKSPLLVVDCWAEWCAPCRMLSPVIEELARDYQGKITFGKLNVDDNQSVAARYQVMSIPTLLIFKNGILVDQKVGALPRNVLEPELARFM
jgi:thioredoxin 1